MVLLAMFVYVKARGHLVADLDPLGIVYADLHSAYEARGTSPSTLVVRDHMLGKFILRLLMLPKAILNDEYKGNSINLAVQELNTRTLLMWEGCLVSPLMFSINWCYSNLEIVTSSHELSFRVL